MVQIQYQGGIGGVFLSKNWLEKPADCWVWTACCGHARFSGRKLTINAAFLTGISPQIISMIPAFCFRVPLWRDCLPAQ